MINTFFNWQVKQLVCPANGWIDIKFDQPVKPNIFCLKNHGEKAVYVGYNYIPEEQVYDKLIYPYSDDVFGSPLWRENIFVRNVSDKDIMLTVYSDRKDDFPWEVLKNTTSVFIQGLSPEIDLSGDSEVVVKQIDSFKQELLSVLEQHFEQPITIPRAGFLGSDVGGTYPFTNVDSINFISNDGTGDLIISFGMDNQVTIHPGEILTDIKNLIDDSFEISSAAACQFRFLYKEKG